LQDSSLATSTASSDEAALSLLHGRISHLDDLIAKGDWTGIVAAAGKYQAVDEQQHSLESGGQVSEEEREALAQAKMWQTIATQSKLDSGKVESAAANSAADWAISRSLEQIQKPKVEEDSESV
jgi:hypothetical protein